MEPPNPALRAPALASAKRSSKNRSRASLLLWNENGGFWHSARIWVHSRTSACGFQPRRVRHAASVAQRAEDTVPSGKRVTKALANNRARRSLPSGLKWTCSKNKSAPGGRCGSSPLSSEAASTNSTRGEAAAAATSRVMATIRESARNRRVSRSRAASRSTVPRTASPALSRARPN